MTNQAEHQIRIALVKLVGPENAWSCNIFKGQSHQGYGWHYKLFGCNPVLVGETLDVALQCIEDMYQEFHDQQIEQQYFDR